MAAQPPPSGQAPLFSPQLQQGVLKPALLLTLHQLSLSCCAATLPYLSQHPALLLQCTACPEPPANAWHTTLDMNKTMEVLCFVVVVAQVSLSGTCYHRAPPSHVINGARRQTANLSAACLLLMMLSCRLSAAIPRSAV